MSRLCRVKTEKTFVLFGRSLLLAKKMALLEKSLHRVPKQEKLSE